MVKTLTIDGVSLLDNYGVHVSGDNAFNSAVPEIETVTIPGRNGDLIYSNKRYSNFELTYPAMIPSEMVSKLKNLKAYLLSSAGYRKIKDSYHPDMYRLGRTVNSLDPSAIAWVSNGCMFDLTFDCKPQHFYDSGDVAVDYTASATITNPTDFDALPIIQVYGTGSFVLNGVQVTIAENNYSYCVLDCETQDAYYQKVNLNAYVTVTDDNFPKLSPGNNTLTIGNGIRHVYITPRWWTV